MLLFGHPYIDFKPFYHIYESSEIELTPPNSTLMVIFNEESLELINNMKKNKLSFALEVETLNELIFAHNLGARYIIVHGEFATQAQAVAENYLFDAKILCRLQTEGDLEAKIRDGIDGVIYPQAIVKISS
jgi:hypothetical protein